MSVTEGGRGVFFWSEDQKKKEREMCWLSSVTSRCGRGIEQAAASELSGNGDSGRLTHSVYPHTHFRLYLTCNLTRRKMMKTLREFPFLIRF